jgi:hypothetical protein
MPAEWTAPPVQRSSNLTIRWVIVSGSMGSTPSAWADAVIGRGRASIRIAPIGRVCSPPRAAPQTGRMGCVRFGRPGGEKVNNFPLSCVNQGNDPNSERGEPRLGGASGG